MFQMRRGDDLNVNVLLDFIGQHEVDKLRYMDLKNQYMSKAKVLDLPDKDPYKPDNRLVANFSRYMVTTFNGFCNFKATKVSHPDNDVNKSIQNFWKNNDMGNVLDELGKITSIYGRGYMFMYQNEDSETEVAYLDPFEAFVIYSKEIKPRSLYGIRYEQTEDGYDGEIYEKDQWYDFTIVEGELYMDKPDVENEGALYYGRMPIVEFVQSEDRQGLFEPVITLLDQYDKALSEKANDVDYFADEYLAILGADINEDSARMVKENRMIVLPSRNGEKVDVKFLSKTNSDQLSEHLLDRIERLIYTLGMVDNSTSEEIRGSGVASGEALKVKQQSMRNMASSKQSKFQTALQTMFSMFFNLVTNVSSQNSETYRDIVYSWTLNALVNESDLIDDAIKLEGLVSKHTQLSRLPFITDVDAEIARVDQEAIDAYESNY